MIIQQRYSARVWQYPARVETICMSVFLDPADVSVTGGQYNSTVGVLEPRFFFACFPRLKRLFRPFLSLKLSVMDGTMSTAV